MGNNEFRIECPNEGYLEGSAKHIRPYSAGKQDSEWITWKKIKTLDGFLIQCKANGSYLNGSKHIRSQSYGTDNLGWITWKLIKSKDGYFIQCQANGEILNGCSKCNKWKITKIT